MRNILSGVGMEGSKSKCLQQMFSVEAELESKEGEWVDALEQEAIDYPNDRERIANALEAYAEKHKGSSMHAAAKSAAARIAAVTMLEIFHDSF